MLNLEVIEPSDSTWRSLPILVPKPDASVRFCINFRRLNAASEFDAYPMPRVQKRTDPSGLGTRMTSFTKLGAPESCQQ